MKLLMKAWSVLGLLFMAAFFATIPISTQVTPRGVELHLDQAQAQIAYGSYRRVTRRAYRAAPGYYYYGWVPNYGPPVGAYPGGYYQPYYPYPGHDVPRWGGFYFGDFYSVF
jgi:hypothetical protein